MMESLVPWKQNVEDLLVPKGRSAGIQLYRLLRIKRKGNEVKYQVKWSVQEVNGPCTDYKSRADHCQEVTVDNIPLMSDIFQNFINPFNVTLLPIADGKETEYIGLMMCIDDCAPRIHMSFHYLEVSAPIVNNLVDKIMPIRHAYGKDCHFNWYTLLYSNR